MIAENKIQGIIEVIPAFSVLSDSEWAKGETMIVEPTTSHGVEPGRKLEHAMFVLSGSIRIYKIGESGREITLYRVGAGECCVLMMASILGDMEYSASVAIESETEMILFPVEDFKVWMGCYPQIQQMIYRQFIVKWNQVANLLEQVTFDSISERLCNFLFKNMKTKDSEMLVEMTHEEIAIELGSSREVITRILKEFAVQGRIRLRRGKIIILDWDKVKKTDCVTLSQKK